MKSLNKGRATTTKQFLIGGPWGGQYAVLPAVTMVFSCQGFKGRYNGGRWQDVHQGN